MLPLQVWIIKKLKESNSPLIIDHPVIHWVKVGNAVTLILLHSDMTRRCDAVTFLAS